MYTVFCSRCDSYVFNIEVGVIVNSDDSFLFDVRSGECECIDESFDGSFWKIEKLKDE
jgi:hypothetical protein